MTIAVNAIHSTKKIADNGSSFLQEILIEIATHYSQHQFVFIVDKTIAGLPKNIIQLVAKPVAKNAVALKYFYEIKLPLLLKKHKPNVIIQMNECCSLSSSTPQLLVVKDLPKKNLKHILKAKQIITPSQYLKNELIEKYKVDGKKIDVVYGAAKPLFQPLNFEQLMQVKDGFADGREYFLWINGKHEAAYFVDVLKAFSLFKKWQQSNMKLLVLGSIVSTKNDIAEKIKTYKYKDYVVILPNTDEAIITKIMAAAYCVLYPYCNADFNLTIVEALQVGVPVITNNNSYTKELAADAAIYLSDSLPEALAEKMQLVYKDETLRSKLINTGLLQAKTFDRNTTTEQVWSIVENVSN